MATTEQAGIRRRALLAGTAAGVGALAVAIPLVRERSAQAATASRRAVYSLNPDWRFVRQDVAGAQAPSFNDSAWATVSVPHTYNDVDSFDNYITSSGESAVAMQVTWYRKRFTMPAAHAGMKVLLEFEGVRQAATVYVNGTHVGLYENGVAPFGFDITNQIQFGAENVIAVKADNTKWRPEQSTGMPFQWDSRDFNPTYGGLTRNVRMYVVPRTYFTLPLYTNLRTSGTYVYPSAIDVPSGTATINIEAQVRNEESTARTLTVSANVIQADGTVLATVAGATVTLAAGATQTVKLSQAVSQLRFWEPAAPNLYTVEVLLSEAGTVMDAYPILTGLRKTAFRGGTTGGGVYINDKYLFLTGYAIRATNEWAVIGGAVPEWMTQLDGQLMRDSKANLIRWMHVAASPANIRMTDQHGIVSVQPAGDKEKDVTGRQWDQRVELMRDVIIYFRNNPSILFWEAGNNWITAAHMTQMTNLRKTWDPSGGRVMGCRAISDEAAYGGRAAVDAAEYVGTMLNRHYSVYARDRKPIIESEYTREEAPRRVWDNFSPPDFGYITGPDVTHHLTSEQFAGPHAASTRYEFWGQRVQGPGDRRYSGAAALIWADSNQHGRQYGWECARLSGRVDAARLPKESLHSFRVMQNAAPDLHLIGHWTYPSGTRKTVYVMASAPVRRVQLLVNGLQVGNSASPGYDFLYTFPGIAWQAGNITAVGYDSGGAEVVRASHTTTDAAVALKLTPYTGPDGLRADGSDIAFFDVEAIDSSGRRMPTHQARVDFTLSGPGRFLGGFNSHVPGSVHRSYVNTECGINRVFVRAGRANGSLTLTATATGLTAATATISSVPFTTTGGLVTITPGSPGPTPTPSPSSSPSPTASPSPGGYVKLVNRHSGKVLGVAGGSTADSAAIVQQTGTGAASQQWQIADAGGGYVKLINRNSGKVCDVNARSTADGAAVIQYRDTGATNQHWQLVTSGGYTKLFNRNSGKVLDVYQKSTADGATIVQWADNGGTNQQWTLTQA